MAPRSSWLDGKVRVVGVGCTNFANHWTLGPNDLLRQAAGEAIEDAGITFDDIDAGWVGNYYAQTGIGGISIAESCGLRGKPMTRVENLCVSGMDALRNACFSIAAGAYDIVLVCGVEKITDLTNSGLPPVAVPDPVHPRPSSPGSFALAASRAFFEWGWNEKDLARVAVKNHRNGSQHPRAHLRSEVTIDAVMESPEVASPLKRLDCCPISDGAAAVVLAHVDVARGLLPSRPAVEVRACEIATATLHPQLDRQMDYLGFPATIGAAKRAYEAANVDDPRNQIDLAECHDCFTITELMNIQDLGFCDPGEAAGEVEQGITDADGTLPVNVSGGLKSFGHPVGATGCRMIYEVTRQLQERALGVQVAGANIGLAHTLGGPGGVAAVTILGTT